MDSALVTPTTVMPATALSDPERPDRYDPLSPPSLRLVCLDIDDTLVDFTAAGQRALATLTGRWDLWPLWECVTEQHVARVVSGELEYHGMHAERTRCFLAELGVLLDADDAERFECRRRALAQQYWRLFDDVISCLDWLRAVGVTIAAVTNASGEHQRHKLAALGLASFFDYVAIAGEVGFAKPDPRLFHAACDAAACTPPEAIHVGDKLDVDAVGAREAGLNAVWLNRFGLSEVAPHGVNTIGKLGELPELLVCEFSRVGVGSGVR